MQEQEIELQVGDTVQIGEYTVTVIDIDDHEVSVRIDPADAADQVQIEDGIVTMDH